MHDLFGGVVYAGIDTDRYKYPIGSGRVTFGNGKSFMKAVKAGFVEIKTPKFTKKVILIIAILPIPEIGGDSVYIRDLARVALRGSRVL